MLVLILLILLTSWHIIITIALLYQLIWIKSSITGQPTSQLNIRYISKMNANAVIMKHEPHVWKKKLRYDTITIHHIHHDHIRWYTWFHQCSNTKQILSSSPSSSSIPIPIIRFLASHNPIKNWINKLDQSFKNSAIATDDKEEEIFASNQTINNPWSRHRSKWTTRIYDEIHESNNDLKTTLV